MSESPVNEEAEHERTHLPFVDDEGRCNLCGLIVERDALRARVAAVAEIVQNFAEDDGADSVVGKVQELLDCYREASARVAEWDALLRDALAIVRRFATATRPDAEAVAFVKRCGDELDGRKS